MDQVKIGKFLKELRKEKGLTQEQLAEKLNVSNRSISRYETGNNMPDISLLIEIADIFEVSLDNLLGREIEVVAKKRRTRMSKEEVEFIKEIRKSERVFHLLTTNPKRCASLINKKLS